VVTRGTGTTGIVLTEGTSLGEDDAYVTASGLGNALLKESPLFPGRFRSWVGGGRETRDWPPLFMRSTGYIPWRILVDRLGIGETRPLLEDGALT